MLDDVFYLLDYKEQAAEALKLTAPDLQEIHVIDEIIEETIGGAHKNPNLMFKILKTAISNELKNLKNFEIDKLIEQRHEKFLNMGYWEE